MHYLLYKECVDNHSVLRVKEPRIYGSRYSLKMGLCEWVWCVCSLKIYFNHHARRKVKRRKRKFSRMSVKFQLLFELASFAGMWIPNQFLSDRLVSVWSLRSGIQMFQQRLNSESAKLPQTGRLRSADLCSRNSPRRHRQKHAVRVFKTPRFCCFSHSHCTHNNLSFKFLYEYGEHCRNIRTKFSLLPIRGFWDWFFSECNVQPSREVVQRESYPFMPTFLSHLRSTAVRCRDFFISW